MQTTYAATISSGSTPSTRTITFYAAATSQNAPKDAIMRRRQLPSVAKPTSRNKRGHEQELSSLEQPTSRNNRTVVRERAFARKQKEAAVKFAQRIKRDLLYHRLKRKPKGGRGIC